MSTVNDVIVFLTSGTGLSASYLLARGAVGKWGIKVDRGQAWIITFCSGLVLAWASAHFALQAWSVKGSSGELLGPWLWSSELGETSGRTLCLFFLASYLTDLVWSQLHYPGQLPLDQTAFAALVVHLLWTGRCSFFAALAVETLPALIESVYKMQGDFRPRLLTGLAIFLGISYHLVITYVALKQDPYLGILLFFMSYSMLCRFHDWFLVRVQCKVQEDSIAAQAVPEAEQFCVLCQEGVAVRGEPRSSAPTPKYCWPKLSIGVRTHFAIVGVLVIFHISLHAVLSASHNSASHYRFAEEGNRFSGLRALDLLIQMFLFLAFARIMTLTIWDAWHKHFIEAAISKKTVIYNISWEDPRIEREALGIDSEDVILTISSAGCNVLDYLIEGPKAIIACDFNSGQLALLEMKLACIKLLTYEQFFKIWAESDFDTFVQFYRPRLRAQLSSRSQEFWDENHSFIKDNFMYSGTSGVLVRCLLPFLNYVGMTDYMVRRLRRPPVTLGFALVQKVMYSQYFLSIVDPIVGVPEAQADLLKREPHVIVERWKDILGRRMWMLDNYFYYGYLAGKWTKECCPRYLEECNFEKLRSYADRVTLFYGPVAAAAKVRQDITFASLLDSMDWMPDSMIAEQMAALAPQMRPGYRTRVFWRSFATKVHSPVLAQLLPENIPDHDGSERVGFYMSQWVSYARMDQADFSQFLCRDGRGVFKNTLLDDIRVMSAMVKHAFRKEKSVEAFYESQGSSYDGFRESLLPDRDRLLKYCLPWHKKPKTWLSVGCGTARDIEYVVDQIKASETRLFLLDLSPHLLQKACERVKELGLSDQVTVLLGDVCKAFPADGMVEPGAIKAYDADWQEVPAGDAWLAALASFEIVTCSYCLTMIPAWQAALDAMVRALKVGGALALIDFTMRTDCPEHWTQSLYQNYFALDGVYFDEAHPRTLQERADLRTMWFQEGERRVPYTPLTPTHYMWTGIKV